MRTLGAIRAPDPRETCDFEPKPIILPAGELPAARYIVPLVRFDLSDPPAYEFTDEDLEYLLWRIQQDFYPTPEQEGVLIRCEEIADVGGLALPPRPGGD